MTLTDTPPRETLPVYLYAVVPADSAEPAPPLRLICHEDLAVVVSPPPSPFLALAAQLREESVESESLSRLEGALRSHEEAIERLRASSVVPLRFGTTVATSSDVARFLELNAPALRDSLSRVAGQGEWSVRVYADETAAPAREQLEGSAAPSSGRDYLESRRRERRLLEDERQRREEVANVIESRLKSAASELSALPPSASDRDRRLLLGWVCLAPREAEERLLAALEEAMEATEGARAELTGPWAPYHFVSSLRLDDQGGPLL